MEYTALVKDGKLLYAPDQLAARKEYLQKMEGQIVKETLTKHYQAKSNQQLKAWWGLFAKMVISEFDYRGWDTSYLLNLNEPTGIGVSSGLLKDYMYAKCPCYDEDKRITMSNMNTIQMAKFFDDCRNFAASQWQIVVPEPRKD